MVHVVERPFPFAKHKHAVAFPRFILFVLLVTPMYGFLKRSQLAIEEIYSYHNTAQYCSPALLGSFAMPDASADP